MKKHNIFKTKLGDFLNEQNLISDDMKKSTIEILDESFETLKRRIPQTKKKSNSISIFDVVPLELVSFMKKNNIPDDAYFDGNPNGYDAYDDFLLSWETDVPTTDKDKLKYVKDNFSNIVTRSMYKLFIDNGYKRRGFNSGLLKQFDDTTLYDMYINKDFDRIISYFLLSYTNE